MSVFIFLLVVLEIVLDCSRLGKQNKTLIESRIIDVTMPTATLISIGIIINSRENPQLVRLQVCNFMFT